MKAAKADQRMLIQYGKELAGPHSYGNDEQCVRRQGFILHLRGLCVGHRYFIFSFLCAVRVSVLRLFLRLFLRSCGLSRVPRRAVLRYLNANVKPSAIGIRLKEIRLSEDSMELNSLIALASGSSL
jgi:hypothetical protein